MSAGHIFISHSSADKAWVTALAKNLQRRGYEVWLDIWHLTPGRSFIRGLQDALEKAHAGILVVTPEARASGWVQDEYEVMLRRKNTGSDFVIIPVVLGNGEDFPFLGNIHCVDFRNHERYRRSLYEVICGVEGNSPGPDGEVEGELEIPPIPHAPILQEDVTAFLDRMFGQLEQDQLTMLLAQDGMATGPVTSRLLEFARRRFGADNVLHLVARCASSCQLDAYFSALARQCGTANGDGTLACLEGCLEDRLLGGQKLCLVIDHFESGPDAGRRQLASMLRGLHERFIDRLRIVFRGGEKLFDLKYDQGDISILNHVVAYDWPELTPFDLKNQYEQRFQDELPDDEAGAILAVSGGEPRMALRCLQKRRVQPGLSIEAYRNHLLSDEVILQLYAPIARERANAQAICTWLDQKVLGSALQYFSDPLWRSLYWRNLLTKRHVEGRKSLVWRCDVLREAGRELLCA